MAHGEIAHLDIPSDDLERVKTFYADLSSVVREGDAQPVPRELRNPPPRPRSPEL